MPENERSLDEEATIYLSIVDELKRAGHDPFAEARAKADEDRNVERLALITDRIKRIG